MKQAWRYQERYNALGWWEKFRFLQNPLQWMSQWKMEEANEALCSARARAIDEAIHEVATGRTINNFGHVPEVRRALQWVVMDLRRLKERAALSPSPSESESAK